MAKTKPKEYQSCPKCFGWKEVFPDTASNGYFAGRVECPKCKGTGRIEIVFEPPKMFNGGMV